MKMHLVVLIVAIAGLAPSTATLAQGCNGYGYGYGCGYDYGYLYNSLDYNVPYFAAHPPVYYSYPVPRTYGYSPFAYPPNVMTPDVAMDTEPMEIINPYVPTSKQEKSNPPVDQTASIGKRQPQPLVVINPFVSGQGSIARTEQ